METLNRLLDMLWFGIIAPAVLGLGKLLQVALVDPLIALGLPVTWHMVVLALLLASLSLLIRAVLRVDDRLARFNADFDAKRAQQRQLQLIKDRRSRNLLYRSSDEELNHDYNTFLAHHYGRYVLIYLLPLFLALAWLNQVFDQDYLAAVNGLPFVLVLPRGWLDIAGLGVNAVFLPSYLLCLALGFRLLRWWQRRQADRFSS